MFYIARKLSSAVAHNLPIPHIRSEESTTPPNLPAREAEDSKHTSTLSTASSRSGSPLRNTVVPPSVVLPYIPSYTPTPPPAISRNMSTATYSNGVKAEFPGRTEAKTGYSPPQDTQGLSADSFLEASAYAARARRLVKMVNVMRDAGAHMDLDLPTIVVCGNQSVGKSSVLEALCGVVLPRNEGTCTRCVTEVRMSENDTTASDLATEWNCTVKLRYEYDSMGRPLKAVKEIPFGTELHKKEDVELIVRRAQKALLNPSTNVTQFLQYNFDDSTASTRDAEAAKNELRFSKNVICLDIRGAGVNLTLIDLPGIIRSVDKREDAQYIDMVQDLVRLYISKERAIIVAAITCKDEIDNQAIVHMAKEVDPHGMRTLGVLTKPDTIEAGTHDRWLQVMLGHQYNLKLGYWMIKNPSKADLDRNITFDEARKMEEAFFSGQAPWSTIRRQLDRFGIDSLRRELSRQLTMLTEMSIPDMQSRTEEAIQATVVELNNLPPSLGENSRIELLQMVRHFCTLVNYNVTAHQDFKQFYQQIRKHFDVFREAVASTRPQFAMSHGKGGVAPATAIASLSTSISSSISSVVGWGTGFDPRRAEIPGNKQAKKESGPVPEATEVDSKKPITVHDVRRIIDAQKGRELQGYSAYDAFTYVVSMFQEEWAKDGQMCLAAVNHELHTLIGKLTDDVFGRFANLQGQVRFVIQAFQNELYRSTSEVVNNLVTMERRYPFTMGSDEFTRTKSNALHEFRAQLEAARNGHLSNASGATSNGAVASSSSSNASGQPPKVETVNKALAALAEAGFTGLSARDLTRLRSETPEDDEVLHVMAASHAYFRVACRRFSDNVPMNVDFHFMSRFSDLLEKELVARLGILEKDNAAVDFMLQENRFVAERRRALEDQRTRLEAVWRSLHEFGY
ncbi:P-loop containing nucleoside triphosphate hydrolase protein [Fimicolochytrium jonesii]|uniref:P-loop containing nucleoside triphosphate hydrolase protein n=1 Tax=Fimicolochytrium jonesii TaxID=1396493 RepID=UPI0022FE32FA|nr:P-loop containing nucleoside triphosphate hydrolase protein [Fimicolochytrium jonesii]KAI8819361.1 P-loop containing nucleoside triphosphate hydrolase protein [Fimicolochytrium jonesii]